MGMTPFYIWWLHPQAAEGGGGDIPFPMPWVASRRAGTPMPGGGGGAHRGVHRGLGSTASSGKAEEPVQAIAVGLGISNPCATW